MSLLMAPRPLRLPTILVPIRYAKLVYLAAVSGTLWFGALIFFELAGAIRIPKAWYVISAGCLGALAWVARDLSAVAVADDDVKYIRFRPDGAAESVKDDNV